MDVYRVYLIHSSSLISVVCFTLHSHVHADTHIDISMNVLYVLYIISYAYCVCATPVCETFITIIVSFGKRKCLK